MLHLNCVMLRFSNPEEIDELLTLIDKHITITRGFSVAINLLNGIVKKGVINPSKKAIHLPRTVSDLDDSTIIMFIDEFQNTRMPQYDDCAVIKIRYCAGQVNCLICWIDNTFFDNTSQ